MEKSNFKKILSPLMKYGLPLVITVGLCYLLFTGIDFNEMVAIIKRDCNFWWIGLALFISIFSHVFRAMRWRIQLQALGVNPPLINVVYSIFGTYAVNLVFPRLGEVWRTGYIAQRQNAPFTTVFGSMVADRLADTVTVALLTVVTFLLAGSALMQFVQKYPGVYTGLVSIATSPWTWIGLVACVVFLWWFFTRKTSSGLVLKVRKAIKELWEGFAVIATMPGKGRWLLLTVCLWGCYFTQFYVAFYAFPFTTHILEQYGAIAALVGFVLSSISMGIPSNGGIGPWQIAVIFGLGIYGLDATSAGAFANLVLGSQTLLLILLGIYTFTAIALEKRRKPSPAPLKTA
ncbi:MAG: flippase-like domain-containing protein [Pseudoflavonifractor sp.]|nr:flippase-like domain-containing protein [Pseudoflavonifractor sp.]